MNRSLIQSFSFHFIIVFFFMVILNFHQTSKPQVEEFEFQVFDKPQEVKEEVIPVINAPKAPAPTPVKPVEAVYGVSRKSLTTDSAAGIEVKAGNTLAKDIDEKKLKADDPDSLPTPTAEYLVTSMPVVLNEVRPVYPPAARAQGFEGRVVMDVLIDQQGLVREATLVSDPGHGLGPAAIEAMKKFKFRPARMEKKAVAVRIKYVINFVLEE